MKDKEKPTDGKFSRRGFLKGTSLGVAAGTMLGSARAEIREQAGLPQARLLKAAAEHKVTFSLNGAKTAATVRTGHTLLETLRDQLEMTGTKLVCDHGTCGACTVLLDGEPVNSCLTLACDADGRTVETVEGLAQDGKLSPIQEAFAKEDALQCGFCTPGMVMSCTALLRANKNPSREETQQALCGNICRCGTYINIFRAVDSAVKAGGK
ncbi:MAG: (2Fe-2S)-binding protein [Planctomycetota bacterium]|nr:(2Fe-2S)-binding protein [Planctomycetota bacterium]